MPPVIPTIPGADEIADTARRWASYAIIDFCRRYDDGQIVASEDLEDFPLPPQKGARWQCVNSIDIEGDRFYFLVPYGD
jgi:hypothetical protein